MWTAQQSTGQPSSTVPISSVSLSLHWCRQVACLVFNCQTLLLAALSLSLSKPMTSNTLSCISSIPSPVTADVNTLGIFSSLSSFPPGAGVLVEVLWWCDSSSLRNMCSGMVDKISSCVVPSHFSISSTWLNTRTIGGVLAPAMPALALVSSSSSCLQNEW